MNYVEVGYQISERHACMLLGWDDRRIAIEHERGSETSLRIRLKELALVLPSDKVDIHVLALAFCDHCPHFANSGVLQTEQKLMDV